MSGSPSFVNMPWFSAARPHARRLVLSVVALMVAAGLVAAPTPAHAAVQAEFYLAPDGDDSNSGTDAAHALATLSGARDRVRALAGDMSGDIIVHVAAGDYHVADTVVFDERDSGTNGFSVVYRQSEGVGTARFIGGAEITSTWSLVSGSATGADADLPDGAVGSVYKTDIGEGLDVNTLYVDDVRATQARTPNRVVDPRFPAAHTNYLTSPSGGVRHLNYSASAIDSTSLTGMVNAQARGGPQRSGVRMGLHRAELDDVDDSAGKCEYLDSHSRFRSGTGSP